MRVRGRLEHRALHKGTRVAEAVLEDAHLVRVRVRVRVRVMVRGRSSS